MNAIELKKVGEQFRMYPFGRVGLKDYFLHTFQAKRRSPKRFWALRGIDLTVKKGEVIGIIGENSSGKTTLLKLIAGIFTPDEGTISVRGKVSALLELGTAFHPELTGRENIYLNGTVLGLSREQINSKFDEIVGYSELGKFINFPLKTYSAGMCMRLGFAIAINVDPDILLVDEVLVVGDESFQKKCLQKIEEFKQKGKTILIVSHDLGLVSALCGKVILLKDGTIIKEGPANKVINFYIKTVGDKKGIGFLRRDCVDLIFNNGSCKLFWQETELTKELGMFTSFLSNGKWYASGEDAVWKCIKKNNTTLVFQGKWKKLPLTQSWKFEMTDDKTIHWVLEVQVNRKIHIEREQIGLMLKDEYRRWSAEDQEGVFPSQFTKDLGSWEIMWVQHSYPGFVSVYSAKEDDFDLPPIGFYCDPQNQDYTVSIQNSDKMFEGRILQCSRFNPGRRADFFPNDRRFLSGKIEIGMKS